MMKPAHHFPILLRKEAARLIQLGLTPAKVAEKLNTTAITNPSLRWPYASRKLIHKWERKQPLVVRKKTSPDNKHLVFVYGTLKRGMGNDRLLNEGGAIFIGNATTMRYFVMFDGGFPRVAEIAELSKRDADCIKLGGHVTGEVWLVDDPTLKCLDQLEGTPRHYRREQVGVLLDDGVTPIVPVMAGMYVIQHPDSYGRAVVPVNDTLTWPTPVSRS